MVCLRNISVDTLHKGDTDDDDNDNDGNNNNNNNNNLDKKRSMEMRKVFILGATRLLR
jgi:hypothetical protein